MNLIPDFSKKFLFKFYIYENNIFSDDSKQAKREIYH